MAARPQNPKVSRALLCCRGYRVTAGLPDARVVFCAPCGVFVALLSPAEGMCCALSPWGLGARVHSVDQKKSKPSDSLAPCSRSMWHAISSARAVVGVGLRVLDGPPPRPQNRSRHHQGLVPAQHVSPVTFQTVERGWLAPPQRPWWSMCLVGLSLPGDRSSPLLFIFYRNPIDTCTKVRP